MFLDPGYNYISQQPLNSSSSHSTGLFIYSARVQKYQNMKTRIDDAQIWLAEITCIATTKFEKFVKDFIDALLLCFGRNK